MDNNKTFLGLEENLLSALCYVTVFIGSLFVLLFEKENNKVRFHAMQSFIFYAVLFLLAAILGAIPLLGGLLSSIINVVIFISVVYLAFMAYKGVEYKIPILGDAVYNQIYK